MTTGIEPCIHGNYDWCSQCNNPGGPPNTPPIMPFNPPPSFPPNMFGPYMGCICPAGANKDCEAPMCPRRNPIKSQFQPVA